MNGATAAGCKGKLVMSTESNHPIPDWLVEASREYSRELRSGGEVPRDAVDDLCARFPRDDASIRAFDTVFRCSQEAMNVAASSGVETFFIPGSDEDTCDSSEPERADGSSGGPTDPSILSAVASDRYICQAEIGRGGMGLVVKVIDRNLQRPLAMKLLRGRSQLEASDAAETRSIASTPEQRRFLREARVTAHLDHPGIVPVHEVGVDREGRSFFTMKLVKGVELGEIFKLSRAREDRWNLPRAVGVMVKVCQAVGYAHAKGVIHRDLKPANIMVGRFGEVFVMDWGLAKPLEEPCGDSPADASLGIETTWQLPLDEESGGDSDRRGGAALTAEGSVAGTPSFMSPEQAGGHLSALDARADVYSLGAILYALLTGCSPYTDVSGLLSARDILLLAKTVPPKRVLELDSSAPPQLVAICEKAMARNPDDRYASSLEMAEDLEAFIDQRVVKAYRTGAFAEMKSWVTRNRAVATLSIVALLFLMVGAGAIFGLQRRNYYEILPHSDTKRLEDLGERSAALWPARSYQLPEMKAWLREAAELIERLDLHRGSLASLGGAVSAETSEEALAGNDVASPHDHGDSELQRRRQTLEKLVLGLEHLQSGGVHDHTIAALQRRVSLVDLIETQSVTRYATRWSEAISDIAASAKYLGLKLKPQPGLVPIGKDEASGLWEFLHLQTHGSESLPLRVEGKLRIEEDLGLVFVLLPGGTFRMGAKEAVSDSGAQLEPNEDPHAGAFADPPHDVTLSPFFLSKFEMTQAQWLRATGKNPSRWHPGDGGDPQERTLLHPVEQVSWSRVTEVLTQLDLVLPTEAQWEYGVRGGTSTVWWTGSDFQSLQGKVNIADAYAATRPTNWTITPRSKMIDDGFLAHAPAGQFPANPFGLHEITGNVREFCRDSVASYKVAPRDGDGLRDPGSEGSDRMTRGGAFVYPLERATSASRSYVTARYVSDSLGVRPARPVER